MSLSSSATKKIHQCDFCDKLFSTASNLREHRRTHTGEKPFLCKYCGKAFAQSSTHSKHQLVHKNKEIRNGSQERLVQQISGGQQEQSNTRSKHQLVHKNKETIDSSRECSVQQKSRSQYEPRLTKLVESSTSEFHNDSSLFPPETFRDTLNEHKLVMLKTEIECLDDNDWSHSNTVFDKRFDTSLHLKNVHDDIERSRVDQNPIITGMFKNRACELVSLSEVKSSPLKQEFFNVEEIGIGSSSFLTEIDTVQDAVTIRYDEEAEDVEASTLFIRETKTIVCEESKELASIVPRPLIYSKGIGQGDPRTLDNLPKETSIIQLDLTLDDDDDDDEVTDAMDVEEKFQNNTETFFKCIHCSETFSSLEEHVCLAKEAKMFFKCNICQKTFTQYGPFFRHKKTHEDPKGFTVGSSSSADTTMEYKICGSKVTVDLRKESDDISQTTNSFYLKEATSSLQSESERISSTTLQLKEEKENQNDVIIIEEDPVQLCNTSSKDVLENRVIIGKTIEKNSTIYNLSNTDQVDHVERLNSFVASDRNKPQREALSLETISTETENVFCQVKEQASTKKTLQKIGKKVRPYTCLFCPRRFSTSSNTREHMRTHTGEKPFSCHVCHKKFAQSSTRSKHLLIHKYHKLPDSTSYTKEILPRQASEKQCYKTGNNSARSFLPDRVANFKENPRMNPTKSLPVKLPDTKTNHKVCRQRLKRHSFKMPVETASNFLVPSKIAGNKFASLNAKPSWRNGINKNNTFGYQNEEYKNKTNASRSKVNNVRISDNYPNVKTKTSSSPTTAYSTGSTMSSFGLLVGNSKTKIDYLPPVSTPNTTTASMLPRPVSRCASKLLRNARTYRPFRCTYCPRTFSTSGNMKEHVRTHTGEKPFRCEYCHRRFAQSSTHSKHVLIHIRKQQLNCFFCGKFFSQVALLRDHIINAHNTTHEDYSRNVQAANRLLSRSIENNKTKDRLSLSLNVSSESFAGSDNENPSFREEMLKRNETTAAGKSDAKKSAPVLTKKRFLEIDLSTNPVDHLIQKQNKSGRGFQERNDRKGDPTETGITVDQELQENVDSVIAKHSFISESNLSSNLTEGTSVIGPLESEIFGQMLPKSEWSSTATTRPLQHQSLNQMKSSTQPMFEAASIKTKHFEFSSVNKSERMTSLAKDGHLIVDMETLDYPSSSGDFSARTSSFAVEEEESSNNRTHLGGPKIGNEFQINHSPETKQFFNLSDGKEAVNNQQKAIKPATGSAQNKNCDNNLISYYETLSNSGVELQFKTIADTDGKNEENKADIYDRTKSYQLNVPSLFLNIDQSLIDSSSSTSYFISPDDTPINCSPLKVEVDEINKSGTDALYFLNNAQDNKYLNFSRVTHREQSASNIGSELSSRQNKIFVDLNHDLPNHKATRQNSSALLNSELALNSCNGDFSKNFNWLSGVEPKTKSEKEELTTESDENKILASKTEESVVLLKNIKLEPNVHNEPYSKQVQSMTDSSLTQGTIIDDSFSSGSHLKISEVTANVPYPVMDDIEENESSTDNSEQFCKNVKIFDTEFTSTEAATTTAAAAAYSKLSKSRSSESISACHNSENEQLRLSDRLPNLVEKISRTLFERRQKDLPSRVTAGKFECTYCSRSFSSRSNMNEHMRIHTGEKPFECFFCSRRFAQSSTHSKHIQTHLRFRQLVCPQCGKRFLQANNLWQHIRSQHKNSSAAKRTTPHSDPSSPTTQNSSDQTRQISGKKQLNSKTTISVPNVAIESSEDFQVMISELKSVKAENNFLINNDSEQSNQPTNRNVPLINKNYLNLLETNLCQQIRAQHTSSSGSYATKLAPPHSDSLTIENSSNQTKQIRAQHTSSSGSYATKLAPPHSDSLTIENSSNQTKQIRAQHTSSSGSYATKLAPPHSDSLTIENSSNQTKQIRAQHTSSSGSYATKLAPPHSDSLTIENSSNQTKQISSNDTETQLIGFIKNNETTISVPNVSIELSEDLPIMTSRLRSVKAENNSLVNTDSEQSNRNVPLANKSSLNPPDINSETTQLSQSNLSLYNISETSSPKRNNDPQFSSELSVCNSIQTIDTKINLWNPSSDTFDEQSSNYRIYTKGTFSESDTICKSENKNISETSESLPTPLLLPFTETFGNLNSRETRSSAFESKCEICTEVIYSEKSLYAHQQHHFARLAEQRGFDPKSFAIGDLTSLGHFLKENEIKCYDDLENSFEKIVSVFNLEKLREDPSSPIAIEMSVVQKIATNRELSENIRPKSENNSFDREHSVSKISSTLPISDVSSSSSSSSSSSPSRLHPSLHPLPFLPVCSEQMESKSLLCFHRCLFCSKMFGSNADILKYLRNSVEDGENKMASVRTTSNRKFKEYIAWYKHIAIVLGIKLRVVNQTAVKNIQHLKIRFDVEQRLQSLLHRRGLYKCSRCHKEYTTFRSLFFHTGNHLKRLTPRKLTQRIHPPKRFLRKQHQKRSIIFTFLSTERISLNNCDVTGKHVECPRISLPLLCFSRKDHFWLMHHKGKVKAIRSDFQTLSIDKRLPTIEIGSTNWLPLSGAVDSQLEKPQKSFSEEATEMLGPSNKRYDEEKLEWPSHLFLDSVKDNIDTGLINDELNQKDDARPNLDFQSADVNNLGFVKMFGQEVTAMVSFKLQKCVHCRKLFTNISHFRKHLKFHAGKFPVRCSFCLKSCTNFGAFFRHKILTHFENCKSLKNKKSQIISDRKSLKNKKSQIIAGRKSLKNKKSQIISGRWQKDVGSNFDETKTEPESGMNLAAVDTVHISDLVNKVLGSRRSADFSDSTFGQKSSNEDPKITLGMVNNSPRLSDRQVTRIRLRESSEPFELEQNNWNDCILDNFQSETMELAARIKIVGSEYLNEATQDVCTANNLEPNVLSNISDEDCVCVSSSSEPNANVLSIKRNSAVFGQNRSRQENNENKNTVAKQPICQAKSQIRLNPEFNKETSINSFRNDFVLTDSNNGIPDSNSKEDGLTDCIFINDDDVPSEASDLSDRKENMNVANEVIILSDEEIDNDSAKDFSGKSSLISLCNDADAFFVHPKEMQQVSHPKVHGIVSQSFYEPLGTCLQNNKTNCADKSDMHDVDESQNAQIILSTSLSSQVSSKAAANSSTTVDLENASYWSKSRQSFKEYRCLYCTKTCSSASNLKEHMRRHTGERPFSCDVCNKTFAQKSTLSKHTQIHTRFKMLSPSAIHKSASNPGIQPNKQIPIRSSLDSVDSLGKQLKSKQTLNADTNPKSSTFPPITEWDTHVINPDLSNKQKLNDLKPIIENDCLRVTQSSEMISTSLSVPYYTLSSHNSTTDGEIHTIDADVSSNVINRKLDDIEPIIEIENDDSDETQSSLSPFYYVASTSHNDPFPQNSARFPPCKTVSTKSNSTHALNVVAKTFEKPYSCDICNRMFSTAGNLKEHRRTHTGERPFECPFCEKTFVQASTRSRHVKNHSIRFAK